MSELGGEMAHATNDPLARFPSHEGRTLVDGNPYPDLVRQAVAVVLNCPTDCFASLHQPLDHL
jgi:hypothetical protein